MDLEEGIKIFNLVEEIKGYQKEIAKLKQENKQLKEKCEFEIKCNIEFADRIDKAIEHLELKQMRYLNEPDYRICTLDLEEIKDILKGRGLNE